MDKRDCFNSDFTDREQKVRFHPEEKKREEERGRSMFKSVKQPPKSLCGLKVYGEL